MERTNDWQKSSYCAEGNNCVEICAAVDGDALHLRESAAPEATLTLAPARLGAMLRVIRAADAPRP